MDWLLLGQNQNQNQNENEGNEEEEDDEEDSFGEIEGMSRDDILTFRTGKAMSEEEILEGIFQSGEEDENQKQDKKGEVFRSLEELIFSIFYQQEGRSSLYSTSFISKKEEITFSMRTTNLIIKYSKMLTVENQRFSLEILDDIKFGFRTRLIKRNLKSRSAECWRVPGPFDK